jgi:hypothetical protein
MRFDGASPLGTRLRQELLWNGSGLCVHLCEEAVDRLPLRGGSFHTLVGGGCRLVHGSYGTDAQER